MKGAQWRAGADRVVVARCGAVAAVAWLVLLGGAAASAASAPRLVTITPPGPYASGQLVTVNVSANSILEAGRSLTIEECAAPSAPTHHLQCDPRTKQAEHFTAGDTGTALYTDYPLVALPIRPSHHEGGEDHRHQLVCDLSHPCVLVVGWDLDDPGHRIPSAPFLIGPPGGDPNPGTGTPEVPVTLVLPVIAGAILTGWVLLRRRRASTT